MALIKGAGATFPVPVYSRWAMLHFEQFGFILDYQRIGSAGGIAAIRNRSVDFGASDIPLSREVQGEDLVQFPVLIGGVVPVFHLPGLRAGALRMTADILAGIYTGQITRWSHPAIRRENPGRALPDAAIVPINRGEGSGTAWIFARYLSRASRAFATAQGPASRRVGVTANSNAQVSKFVRQFKYTIGYVELSHALKDKLAFALLRNRAGAFVAPDLSSFKAAAAQGTWDGETVFGEELCDAEGAGSWPISGATYVIMRRTQVDPRQARRILEFFHWALTAGSRVAEELHFVPIPRRFIPLIERRWARSIQAAGRPVWQLDEQEGGGATSAPSVPPGITPRASAPSVTPTIAPPPSAPSSAKRPAPPPRPTGSAAPSTNPAGSAAPPTRPPPSGHRLSPQPGS